MKLWHGYPQHPDAHPERPWWRYSNGVFTRSDGGGITVQIRRQPFGSPDGWVCYPMEEEAAFADDQNVLMARIDAAHPLPAPPPLCGQVWLFPDKTAKLLAMVSPMADGDGLLVDVVFGGRAGLYRLTGDPSLTPSIQEWPHDGAVLVAGPGAPWAPTVPVYVGQAPDPATLARARADERDMPLDAWTRFAMEQCVAGAVMTPQDIGRPASEWDPPQKQELAARKAAWLEDQLRSIVAGGEKPSEMALAYLEELRAAAR